MDSKKYCFDGTKDQWVTFTSHIETTLLKLQLGFLNNPIKYAALTAPPPALAENATAIEVRIHLQMSTEHRKFIHDIHLKWETYLGVLQESLSPLILSHSREYSRDNTLSTKEQVEKTWEYLILNFGNSTPGDAERLYEELRNLKLINYNYIQLMASHKDKVNSLNEIPQCNIQGQPRTNIDGSIMTFRPSDEQLKTILINQINKDEVIGRHICIEATSLQLNYQTK